MKLLRQVEFRPRRLAKFAGFSASLLLLGIGLAQLAGCEKKSVPPAAPESPASAAQASNIRVTLAPDSIDVRTSLAEFVLSPNGYLKGILTTGGTSRTLDEPGSQPGQLLTLGHKPLPDLTLDFSKARIREAQGKLGPRGEQIAIPGSSP